MLCTLAAPVAAASGALGSSLVFYSWRGSQCARDFVVPSNPATVNQVIARNTLSSLTKNWKALTTNQRDSWETYAAENLIMDRLGRQVKSTALGWYLACNSMLTYAGASLITSAPAYAAPQPPTGLGVLKVSETSSLVLSSVKYTGTAPANAQWVARIERLPSIAVKPVFRRQTLIGGPTADSFEVVGASASAVDFSDGASVTVGETVGVSLQMLDVRTGLVSFPYTVGATLVSV